MNTAASGKWVKRFVWGVLALALAGGAIYTLRPQPILVEIGTPELRTVQEYIAEEAKTRLADEYIIDMPVSGTLERLALEVGQDVTQGQVIARVDTFELQQQLASLDFRIQQSRAQITGVEVSKPKSEDIDTAAMRVREASDSLSIARKEREITAINLEEAQKNYERVKQLVAEGVTSTSQLDEAQRAYRALEEGLNRAKLAEDAAAKNVRVAELTSQRVEGSIDDNEYLRQVYQAEIESLQAQKKIVESDLRKAEITAPVSGPVLEKYIDDRRVLVAGTPILKLGDLATIEIESDILSEEVGRIEVGSHVELVGKALGGEEAAGTVKRIYPAAFTKVSSLGIQQQRVKVIVAFDNNVPRLRVGTRLDVRIITAERTNTLAVPERSTFRREGEWYVFTVNNGQAHLTPVKIGLKNDEWAELVEGLETDTRIVLEPKNEMVDGVRVQSKTRKE